MDNDSGGIALLGVLVGVAVVIAALLLFSGGFPGDGGPAPEFDVRIETPDVPTVPSG